MSNRIYIIYLQYAMGMFLLVILQQTVIPYTEIFYFTPDLVLLGLLVIAVKLGQIPATIFGFSTGLIGDLFVGDVIGISALAKTLSGFIAGYYFNEEKVKIIIRTPKFVWITVSSAFVHNLIYMFSYVRTVDLDMLKLFLTYGIGSTLYTTLLSVISVLILSRTDQKIRIS